MDDHDDFPFEEIPADAPSAVPFAVATSEFVRSLATLQQIYQDADDAEFRDDVALLMTTIVQRAVFELAVPTIAERPSSATVH